MESAGEPELTGAHVFRTEHQGTPTGRRGVPRSGPLALRTGRQRSGDLRPPGAGTASHQHSEPSGLYHESGQEGRPALAPRGVRRPGWNPALPPAHCRGGPSGSHWARCPSLTCGLTTAKGLPLLFRKSPRGRQAAGPGHRPAAHAVRGGQCRGRTAASGLASQCARWAPEPSPGRGSPFGTGLGGTEISHFSILLQAHPQKPPDVLGHEPHQQTGGGHGPTGEGRASVPAWTGGADLPRAAGSCRDHAAGPVGSGALGAQAKTTHQ